MARILIVDSDPAIREVLQSRLSALGHSVASATDGQNGWRLFQGHRPALVITDFNLPDAGGLTLIQTIRREAPAVKILTLANDGVAPAGTYLRLAHQAGSTYELAKPFSLQELDIVLGTLLGREEAGPSPAALTFVVVDDDEHCRFLNSYAIKKAFPGSSVIECDSPQHALEASRDLPLTAIVTDHHLGEVDGSEFIRYLRAQGTNCPVVMVTGSSDPVVHERAYAAGASGVFGGGKTNFTEYLKTIVRVP